MAENKRITIVLKDKDIVRIRRIAELIDVSVSWVIRQLINQKTDQQILTELGRSDLVE